VPLSVKEGSRTTGGPDRVGSTKLQNGGKRVCGNSNKTTSQVCDSDVSKRFATKPKGQQGHGGTQLKTKAKGRKARPDASVAGRGNPCASRRTNGKIDEGFFRKSQKV